jgi:hypothetical protein
MPPVARRCRLYVDESGDHTFEAASHDHAMRRHFCLLGCAIEDRHYVEQFVPSFDSLKQKHFEHHPDEPIVFHRLDLSKRVGVFRVLRDPAKANAFNADLLNLLQNTQFRVFAVLVDKKNTRTKKFGLLPSHPYHIALLAMLERFCGWLTFTRQVGDVMAESRGGREDVQLKSAYETIYNSGSRFRKPEFFQQVLTTTQLKLKKKEHNVPGLQLADLMAYPAMRRMLADLSRYSQPDGFTRTIAELLETRYNSHVYDGRVSGYGKVFLV